MTAFELLKTFIAPFLSLVAIVISLLAFARSKKLARNTLTMPLFVEFMKQYRIDIQPSYYYIANKDLNLAANIDKLPISEMADEHKVHALKVAHFFEHVGLLVSSRLVHQKYILNFIGMTAYNAWVILGSYIMYERKKREMVNGDIYYQMHFEYFVQAYLEADMLGDNKKFYNDMLKRRNAGKHPAFSKYPMSGLPEIANDRVIES